MCPRAFGLRLLTQNVVENHLKGSKMAESTIWWVLTGAAVAVELVTGTFYLLMLAIGLAAAAVAAHLGASVTVQLLVAAALSSAAILGWRRYRQGLVAGAPAEANRDVNMDIGETVQVEAWGSDGNASVKYRGALWRAAPAPDYTPASTGPHRIVEVVGSQLIVRKA